MTHKVVLIRTRVIEEKIEVNVSSSEPEDAIAIAKHMLDNEQIDWRYLRTVESSEPSVEVILRR